MIINSLFFFRAILTNMLPSFRLNGSEEDLLDIENESMMVQDFDDLLPLQTRALNFKFNSNENSQIDLGGKIIHHLP